MLRQTNYDQAEIALKQFIEMHSANPLAGNARYWLGETYYVRTDYQTAAQVFFEAFQNSPAGPIRFVYSPNTKDLVVEVEFGEWD